MHIYEPGKSTSEEPSLFSFSSTAALDSESPIVLLASATGFPPWKDICKGRILCKNAIVPSKKVSVFHGFSKALPSWSTGMSYDE
jgi:hypothetical protein